MCGLGVSFIKCKAYVLTQACGSMSFSQRLHPAVIALIGRECKGKQRTPAWFLSRGKMLTASEMAAALGIDKYKSRKQLMKQKLRPVKIQSGDSIACAWGNKYEDEAVAKYERMTGRKVLPFTLIQHPKYSWLGASPDGVSIVEDDPTAEPIGLEIKCPFSRELSTTGIPDIYFPQVMHACWLMSSVTMAEGVLLAGPDADAVYGLPDGALLRVPARGCMERRGICDQHSQT